MNKERSPESDSKYLGFYPVIAPLIMSKGVGDGKSTACVMAQAATIDALRKGKTLDKPTDEMECACPILRRLAIRLNDTDWWSSDEERTEHLRPLIPMLLDSKLSEDGQQKRAYLLADNCVRVLTPMRLDWIAQNSKEESWRKKDAVEGAKALRELNPIVDEKSVVDARKVCQARNANANANADANADANAYADANADAYADAYAYSNAESVKEQRLKYRAACIDLFHQLATIKD